MGILSKREYVIFDVHEMLKIVSLDHRLDDEDYDYLLRSTTLSVLSDVFKETQIVYFNGVDIWSQQYYHLFDDSEMWEEIREDLKTDYGYVLSSHLSFIRDVRMPPYNNIHFHAIQLNRNKLIFEYTLF